MNRGQRIAIARRMLRREFVLPRDRDEVARGYLAAVGAASWNEHASAYSPDGWSWGDDPQ